MADLDLDVSVTSTPLSSAQQVRSTLRKPPAKVTANGTKAPASEQADPAAAAE